MLLGLLLVICVPGSAWAQATDRAERARRMSEQAETRGLAEPFKGVTTNGTIIPGLFGIRSTGVSTEPVRKAAVAFLASLNRSIAPRPLSRSTTSNGASG